MTSQRDSWLAQNVEEPLEPELPICDPHHHFWDRAGDRYLLDQLAKDLGGGHNIEQTVFIECGSMYRARGPEELRSIGETEFVHGIAAQSASGQYGPTEVAAGIVGQRKPYAGSGGSPGIGSPPCREQPLSGHSLHLLLGCRPRSIPAIEPHAGDAARFPAPGRYRLPARVGLEL